MMAMEAAALVVHTPPMTNEQYLELKFRGNPTEDARAQLEAFKAVMRKFRPGWLESLHKWNRYSPFIYFIRRGEDGPIKIGLSGDPLRRLRQLQTACAEGLEILLVIPGGREAERVLHDTCKNLCLGGEWYAAEPVMFKLIDKLKAAYYGDSDWMEYVGWVRGS